ncbi:MAG: ATP-binding protein [Pseudomonadota bacterium]
MRVGFMTGFITILFVLFMGATVHLDFKAFVPTISVSGIVMLIIGSGVGRLRDLSLAVKAELHKRREVEMALRKSQDELELRVKERTLELEQTTNELKREVTERRQAQKAHEELQAQLTQTQKMESVGRLAGGVAHDFNNMLGVILGHVDMILEELDPALPVYADLKEIKKAAQRSAGLTRQLLAFARKQTVAPKVLDINRTLEGMLQMLNRLIGEDIALVWLPGQDLEPVYIDPSQIDQMLVNLVVNARDAIADVGRITIQTGTTVFDEEYCSAHPGFVPGEFVHLSVSDDGCGMDQETLTHVFEPFFTTKEPGKGTGLGLATVYGIAKQNNGYINVYSEPGQGTTLKIYLPRHIGKSVLMREDALATPDVRGHETILLVEDEPAILSMTKRMLEGLSYTVVTANTPGEAIRLARDYAGQIHLLMTDVVMPEMNGRDLAKNILSFYPHLKRLFMSGYTANVIAHHGVLDEGVHFIQKPFSSEDLAVKVRESIKAE